MTKYRLLKRDSITDDDLSAFGESGWRVVNVQWGSGDKEGQIIAALLEYTETSAERIQRLISIDADLSKDGN